MVRAATINPEPIDRDPEALIGVSPAAVLNTRQVASSTWTRAMWSRRCGVVASPAA
jgi:hypothetical protein